MSGDNTNATSGPGDAGAVWYYAVGSDRKGPVTKDALQGLVATGAINDQTYAWKPGMADWSFISDIPELESVLQGEAPSETDQVFAGTAPEDDDSDMDDDVFGFESAEDDTSPEDDADGVHGRRESSVLFSLDELAGGGDAAPAGQEDVLTETSGLIDIRAVAQKSSTAGAGDDPFTTTGSAQPDAGPRIAAVSIPIVRQKKSPLPWILAAVLVLGLAGALVYFVVLKKPEPVQVPVAQTTEAKKEEAKKEEPKKEEPKKEEPKKEEAAPAKAADAGKTPAATAPAAADAGPTTEQPDATQLAAPTTGDDEAAKLAAKRKAAAKRRKDKKKKPGGGATAKKDPAPKKADPPPKKKNAGGAAALLGALDKKKKKAETGGGGVKAKLTSGEIRSALAKKKGAFKGCGGGGSVSVMVSVAGNGKAKSVIVGGSAPANVRNCVKGKVRSMSFPKSVAGGKGSWAGSL